MFQGFDPSKLPYMLSCFFDPPKMDHLNLIIGKNYPNLLQKALSFSELIIYIVSTPPISKGLFGGTRGDSKYMPSDEGTSPETNSSHLKIGGWKTKFLLGWPIFRGYVSSRECNEKKWFFPQVVAKIKKIETTTQALLDAPKMGLI